jgi:succinate dehydrogenase/fumarate reductase flavoprotein subunit
MHDDDNGSGSSISRRDLLTVASISAATLAIPTVLVNTGAKSMGSAVKDRYDTDVLIIGTGFAGTFAAIEARRNGLKVVMLDKGTVGFSGLSPWASDSRPFDKTIYDRDEWQRNVAINTEWINDRKWLDIFMDESLEIFEILDGWGIHKCHPFERSKVFREKLLENGVEVVERVMVTSLLQDASGHVGGALGFSFDDSVSPSKAVVVPARAVILCTGAGAYKSPGFPNWGQTFDGDAMAYAAGASITGKEFNDTHGTTSNYPAARQSSALHSRQLASRRLPSAASCWCTYAWC